MPQVSVIVPVYKVEPYLHRCVDSILAQTYSDFELILVDDGSPDSCGSICDDYARQDCRVRVIHKENGGLSSARNAGLDMACGTYVCFVDSDDYIAENMLETVLPSMENGADLTVYQAFFVHEDGSRKELKWGNYGSISLDSERERYLFLVQKLLNGYCGWEAWNRMFVREKIERHGLRFADNRKVFAEDLYFSLCYMAHTERIEILDYTPYYYIQHGASIMASQKKKINIGRYNELSKTVLEYYEGFPDCRYLVERFPAIHFRVVTDHLDAEYRNAGVPAAKFRELVRQQIADWDYFETQLRACIRLNPRVEMDMGRINYYSRINYVRFLLGGSAASFDMVGRILGWLRKE